MSLVWTSGFWLRLQGGLGNWVFYWVFYWVIGLFYWVILLGYWVMESKCIVGRYGVPVPPSGVVYHRIGRDRIGSRDPCDRDYLIRFGLGWNNGLIGLVY